MMRRLPLALALFLACGRSPLPPDPEDPVRNLAQLDAFADRAQTEALRAAWLSATEGTTKAKTFGVLPLLLLKDEEVAALGRQLREPHQQRCLQAIHDVAVRMQSEADPEVAKALAQITPLWEQSQPELLEPWIRNVIAARTSWAQRRSQSKYLALMRRHRGYDPETAERIENEVRRALRPAAPLGEEPAIGELFEVAYSLERASFVFELLGLPRKPPALQVRDVRKMPSFYAIDPPRELGLTTNPAGGGIAPHRAAFHESGHAAMALLTEPSATCRTSRRAVSPAVSESLAKIAEELFFSPEWLATQGVPPGEIENVAQWERQWERTRMRSVLHDLEFERRIYDDPTMPGTPGWTAKRHLAFEPLERVDYLFARCAQAAVYRRLRALPGGLLGEQSRAVLRDEVFRGASGLRFEEWFRRATGTEPDCAAWLHNVRH